MWHTINDSDGAAHSYAINGFDLIGKTGTAQKVQDGHYMTGNYITSFIGFMPADDPEIVIYVAVDNAKGITQYGGTVAAPIAKNILLDAISIFNISPRENEIEREYNYLDKQYSEVPNVLGMTKEDAIKALAKFNVVFVGDGDNVKYQSPSSGEKIYEGETVRLLMN